MSERFATAIALFDAANSEDPNQETAQGKSWPKELLYSQRMAEMLERFAPDANEQTQLAVRAQHIQRWKSPRDAYPMDRNGYLQWRTSLYKFHAETAGRLLAQAGYPDDFIEEVKQAVGKRGIKINPNSQMLEDCADLVFLEHYLLDFATKHPDYSEEKWLEIIRKTWRKMSSPAQQFALSGQLKLPEALLPLIHKAVGES
jgi:hypothetical protein